MDVKFDEFNIDIKCIDKLLKKRSDNPVIVRYISFHMRTMAVYYDFKKIEPYIPLIKNLLSHPDLMTVRWASRSLGEIAAKMPASEKLEILEEIYKLLQNPNEEVVAWALIFIGKPEASESDEIRAFEQYNHVIFVLGQQKKSGKVIESALWCLGNMALRQRIKEIPKEVASYLDPNILSTFINGEKIILFACHFIANLVNEAGANKHSLSNDELNKIVSLLDYGNQKIKVWAICFFGSLSSNAREYNAETRRAIGAGDIIYTLVGLLNSEAHIILEAALWSLHKIAWCAANSEKIRGANAEKFFIQYLNHPVDKIAEGACLCVGAILSYLPTQPREDQVQLITELISRIMTSAEAMNDHKQLLLIAIRALNTLCTQATQHHEFNRKLREIWNLHPTVVRLLKKETLSAYSDFERELLLESALWLLGNLALDEENAKALSPLILDDIAKLLKESKNSKVLEGAGFCFINVVIARLAVNSELAVITTIDGLDPISFIVTLFEKDSEGKFIYEDRTLDLACFALNKLMLAQELFMQQAKKLNPFESIIALLHHPRLFAGAAVNYQRMVLWDDNNQVAFDEKTIKQLVDMLKVPQQWHAGLNPNAVKAIACLRAHFESDDLREPKPSNWKEVKYAIASQATAAVAAYHTFLVNNYPPMPFRDQVDGLRQLLEGCRGG